MIDLCGIDVLFVYKQKKKGGGRNGHGMKSFIATVLNTLLIIFCWMLHITRKE